MTKKRPIERPNFFAPDTKSGWYRPLTERQASARLLMADSDLNAPELYYVPTKDVPKHAALEAQDSYSLLRSVAFASAGARAELARTMVDYLIDGGEEQLAKFRRLTVLHLKDSALTLQGRPDLAMYEEEAIYGDNEPHDMPWYGADFPTATPEALEQALHQAELFNYRGKHQDQTVVGLSRPADEDADGMGQDLAVDVAVAQALLDISQAQDGLADPQERARIAQALVDQLEPGDLVRALEDLEPTYGLSAVEAAAQPDYDRRLQLDAADLAVRHWDEVAADGAYPGGISLANGQKQLYPAQLIETAGTKIQSLDDLQTAKAAPQSLAPVVPLFGRR
ncbi:MAG: hypothetical protein AAF213_00770 [Pseudomonadota bacterium]